MSGPGTLRKVLIANRGEIACRLIAACREYGLATVAVYATPDADAPHVTLADEAYELPGESYLDADRLLAVAAESGADALHPGYGFLSESAAFAIAVEAAGLTWVGPPAGAIAQMGHKLAARHLAAAANVPVLPGDDLSEGDPPTRFPVMVKAAGGGGGLGLRRVDRAEDLDAAVQQAREQCAAAFGIPPENVDLYWEAYLEGARHVEVQVVADAHGRVSALGARECSVQRRFQKLIEECPAPALDFGQLVAVEQLAVRVAKEVGYQSAGTVEFLWTPEHGPVFLEMNTRLQVEHPVTELVYGVDLPRLQLMIAEGDRLPNFDGPRGHAIEARVYAEDPLTGAPAAGRIDHLRWPQTPWVRVDAGVQEGQTLPTSFDALLAKVIAWGETREAARRRLSQALAAVEIAGTLGTNLTRLRAILDDPAFAAGELRTDSPATQALPAPDAVAAAQVAAAALSAPIEAAPAASRHWARRAWRERG